MSGGRFLISAKGITYSENTIKNQNLVREGFGINCSFKVANDYKGSGEKLLRNAEEELRDVNSIELDKDSRDISDYVAGYIVHKTQNMLHKCCGGKLKNENQSLSSEYIKILPPGGLTIPSRTLSDDISQGFAILDANSSAIGNSVIPSREAGIIILKTI